jgi:hypothetical protein
MSPRGIGNRFALLEQSDMPSVATRREIRAESAGSGGFFFNSATGIREE